MDKKQILDSFKKAHIFIKIAPFFGIAAFVFDLTGFAAPYWLSTRASHTGIWRFCADGADCRSVLDVVSEGWLIGVRFMETFGFLLGVAAIVLSLAYIFVPKVSGNKIARIVTIVVAYAAVFFIVDGGIIFAIEKNDALGTDYDWAYILTMIGGSLYCGIPVMYALDWFLGAKLAKPSAPEATP